MLRNTALALISAGLLLSCRAPQPTATGRVVRPTPPARPIASASRAFWTRWGDGKAEVAGYHGTVARYGELWPATVTLVYVTEPLSRATLVKDDDAPPEDRLSVLKLNASTTFQTGFYPYSVMTSVFAPVDRYFDERFAPVKLTLSVQEWCGHVYASVFPTAGGFEFEGRSYFASEGEDAGARETRGPVVYEDALLVQLRELDGPFASGGDFEGQLVPGLFRNRRAHAPLVPVQARITRTRGEGVVRFRLVAGDYEREFEVEDGGERKLLSWRTSEGEALTLTGSQRIAYWEANRHGGEASRAASGLDATPIPRPTAPAGTRAIGR